MKNSLNIVQNLRSWMRSKTPRLPGSARNQAGAVRSSRGDTIIEVMISMTILSLALTIAYTLSSTSLKSGLESNQRTEALSLAQAQVELLANAKDNDAAFTSKYQVSSPFCINLDASKNVTVGADQLCSNFNGAAYNVGISYSSATNVFTITSQWSSPKAPGGVAKLNLYYKLPGVYKKALVVTGVASNVSNNTAKLNGTVNPNGDNVTACYFNYGTTTSYGTKVDCSSLPGGGSDPVSVSVSLNSLTQGNTYHFQLCATNLVGTSCGNDSSFATTNPPTVVTHAATGVGITSATLNGGVNPKGYSVTACYFEYGADIGYGRQVTCSSLPGSGNGVVSVSAAVGSLSGSTTYHFRLCATNLGGTTCGGDLTFTTSANVPTANLSASPQSIGYGAASTLTWSSTYATSCTGGGFSTNGSASGSKSTGALYTNTTYTLSCSGAGGTSPTASYTVSVASPPPPPPPPPPSCTATAGGFRSGSLVWISGGGSGCSYYYDSWVGWNGGGTWGPISSWETVCHTQSGGVDPWGWLSSQQWCG